MTSLLECLNHFLSIIITLFSFFKGKTAQYKILLFSTALTNVQLLHKHNYIHKIDLYKDLKSVSFLATYSVGFSEF